MQLRHAPPASRLRGLGYLREEVRREKNTVVEKNRSVVSRVVTEYKYIKPNELTLEGNIRQIMLQKVLVEDVKLG